MFLTLTLILTLTLTLIITQNGASAITYCVEMESTDEIKPTLKKLLDAGANPNSLNKVWYAVYFTNMGSESMHRVFFCVNDCCPVSLLY
jgi:hypothetical protein